MEPVLTHNTLYVQWFHCTRNVTYSGMEPVLTHNTLYNGSTVQGMRLTLEWNQSSHIIHYTMVPLYKECDLLWNGTSPHTQYTIQWFHCTRNATYSGMEPVLTHDTLYHFILHLKAHSEICSTSLTLVHLPRPLCQGKVYCTCSSVP